jgi:two-component system alkaline phosphatase synthesis response regulator PhoP
LQACHTILLVEDDTERARFMCGLLARENYAVQTAADGRAGFDKAQQKDCALAILKANLPGRNGLDICCDMRKAGIDIPILILTHGSTARDRVLGLKLGADDCLAMPFDTSELLARVEALLRRVGNAYRIPVRTFQFNDVEMDFERAEVRKAGQSVVLAARELELLHYLVQHRGRVVPRNEILGEVWQYNGDVVSRTVDVHIWWLRKKLDHTEQPQHIQTVRGRGYRFVA